MKVDDFIKALRHTLNFKTVYMWGTFGQRLTEALIAQKTSQYPSYYTGQRQSFLKSKLNQNYWAFDCIGLIKGVIWGWTGDPTHPRGGAGYQLGMPDVDANMAFKRCIDISSDFSKIEIGNVVWIKGHIGVYLGNGEVIEATPGWSSGVQITTIPSIKKSAKERSWTSHGKLPWIDYNKKEPEHWAQKHYDSLIKKGLVIHEKRFDEPITRGEVLALLDRMRG